MAMKVTNTAKDEVNPAWLMGGNPNAIEAQESRGQTELVNSTLLPVDVQGRDVMEQWGVVFGEPQKDDPLFCQVQLPDGWTREPSDHAMWSYVCDDKGRRRIAVFYKAAFYDRSAHMNTMPRFVIGRNYDKRDTHWWFVSCDDKPIFSANRPFEGEEYKEDWKRAEKEARVACAEWLATTYPDHTDPVKSWESDAARGYLLPIRTT